MTQLRHHRYIQSTQHLCVMPKLSQLLAELHNWEHQQTQTDVITAATA